MVLEFQLSAVVVIFTLKIMAQWKFRHSTVQRKKLSYLKMCTKWFQFFHQFQVLLIQLIIQRSFHKNCLQQQSAQMSILKHANTARFHFTFMYNIIVHLSCKRVVRACVCV